MEKKILEKKSTSGVNKNLDNFSRIVGHNKCQRTTYKGTQDILTSVVQVISLYLYDLRGH